MPNVRVKLDLRGMERYKHLVHSDLMNLTQGPVRKAMTQWAARYRSYLQLRFARFSRGGGDWTPLKPATIRRKKSSGILMDTGTMRAALSPAFAGIPGQLEEHGPYYVAAGFGPGTHPKARMAIDELADIHQRGLGKNPAREIVVEPDARLSRQMAADMERALKELGDDLGVS